ncbi:Mpp10 protein [Calocera viscosa TUFC12733]|uniref:U3 small nucleolar ribonucleoprotein protein MPP10 n=1 Tax=Calocera viscosa (strain TUFC12733) TaxID=1330018 RepID=A0A167MPJ3_CALVF|nr:Mpp10 protein [Calocera viscosa TUFC12733]
MDESQIWEQLELRAKRVCRMAEVILETSDGMGLGEETGMSASEMMDMLNDDPESLPEGMEDDDDDDEDDEDDEDPSLTEDETEENEDEDEEGDPEEGYGEEGIEELHDEEDVDDDDIDMDAPGSLTLKSSMRKRPRHPTLDDEFFSIDDFNRETEAMEARTKSAGHLGDDGEDDEIDEDVDLFEAVEDDAEVEEAEPSYGDFFAPVRGVKPNVKAQRPKPVAEEAAAEVSNKPGGVRFNEAVRVKTIKPKGKQIKLDFNLSQYPFMGGDMDEEGVELEDEDDSEDAEEDGEDDLEDMEGIDDFDMEFGEEDGQGDEDLEDGAETITRLKDDLFGEEDEEVEAANMSTHEKRLAALSEQIQALEAANVADKAWTLMGEAGARSRPVNSLLEEDLDFEHVAKQVPVITEETTRTLEELIKKRILDNNFNDVVRKRPVDDKPFLPSRMFELQDSRSQKSLAQIYEDEYTAARTGDTSILDDRDGKLKKEHAEIEKMWEDIAYKLDALSNAHFTPKAPKATIQTVSNLPSISMESAMPTTNSTATMLAPEEVFATSKQALVSKSEMTPSDKKAQRRKNKAAFQHEHGRLSHAVQSFGKGKTTSGFFVPKKGKKGVRGEKEDALKKVVKEGRGVTVIGKESKAKKAKIVPRASLLKL